MNSVSTHGNLTRKNSLNPHLVFICLFNFAMYRLPCETPTGVSQHTWTQFSTDIL